MFSLGLQRAGSLVVPWPSSLSDVHRHRSTHTMKRTIAKQQKIPFASFERIPGPKHAAYASPLLILQSSLDTLRSSLPEGLHYKRGLFVLVHETISSQTTERSSSSSSLVLRLVLRFPKIAKVFKREKVFFIAQLAYYRRVAEDCSSIKIDQRQRFCQRDTPPSLHHDHSKD
jgi:hypothetical protein